MKTKHTPKPRGFAAMSRATQRRIAVMGGKTVSKNRRHMAEIGALGGKASKGGRSKRAGRPAYRVSKRDLAARLRAQGV